MEFSISLSSEDLSKWAAKKKMLAPLLQSFGEYALRRAQKSFTEERSPNGSAWTALTPEYKKRKKQPQILTESATLRRSITYQIEGLNTVKVGTNVVYGAAHQFGYPPRNLPARPYLGLSSTDIPRLEKIVKAFLLEEK